MTNLTDHHRVSTADLAIWTDHHRVSTADRLKRGIDEKMIKIDFCQKYFLWKIFFDEFRNNFIFP